MKQMRPEEVEKIHKQYRRAGMIFALVVWIMSAVIWTAVYLIVRIK